MFNVIGRSSFDQFTRVIMGGVSRSEAEAFVRRHKGIYVDVMKFYWYLSIEPAFPMKGDNI